MNDELYEIMQQLTQLSTLADSTEAMEENKAAALVNAIQSAISALRVARYLSND